MTQLLGKIPLALAKKPIAFEKQMRFIPILLPIVSFLLCIIIYILDEIEKMENELLFWLPFTLIQIVIAITCGLLIKEFYYGAHKDILTGLYNRRYLNFKLDEEISRVKRTQSPLSLILIDVDNFKKVNDVYGHLMGDKVLKRLGEILRRDSRDIDITARWGGEEFAIVLPETPLEGAQKFAERLRKAVENYDFGFQVTISLGIVSMHKETSFDELLTQADQALYLAKEKKNIVVVYPKLGYYV